MSSKLAERCRGRWKSIIAQLGVLDSKALAGKDVPCPRCGGVDRFRFSDQGFGRFFCRHCGGGDGVKLLMMVRGISFPEAARLVETVIGEGSSHKAKAHFGAGADKPRDPLRSWREASSIVPGSTVDIYLKGRAIALTEIEARSLRFHPALFHWPTKTRWPVMVALVAHTDRTAVTCHQTFLEPDGSGKAPLDKARLFPAGVAPVGGVWFGEAHPEREFIVGEGVESLLSAMRLFGAAAGCAALSALGVSKLILPPQAQRLRVFADNDALGQGLSAAREAGRRWVAEGRTVAVSISPKVGEDANDVLLRRSR